MFDLTLREVVLIAFFFAALILVALIASLYGFHVSIKSQPYCAELRVQCNSFTSTIHREVFDDAKKAHECIRNLKRDFSRSPASFGLPKHSVFKSEVYAVSPADLGEIQLVSYKSARWKFTGNLRFFV